MKFDCVIMNPPYSGSLHLKILEKALKFKKEDGVLINLSPVRWLEDPLWKYKRNTDHEKYQKSIVDKISELKIISVFNITKLFGICYNGDLGIYIFNGKKGNIKIFSDVAQRCYNKIFKKEYLHKFPKVEADKQDGWRLRIETISPINTTTAINTPHTRMQTVGPGKAVVWEDGYYDGKHWTEYRKIQNNGTAKPKGSGLPYSIKLRSKEEAENVLASCNTKFYWNAVQLIKPDQNTPLFALPYMEDYTKAWTDADYCDFFGLTEEESEFMCRDVEDYRVKDFIKYEEI